MPTTRPRHVVTETPDVARALDEAAKHWPEDAQDRRRLLLRLIAAGHHVVAEERETQVASQQAAVARTSGALTGVYGTNYLTELREDWPE